MFQFPGFASVLRRMTLRPGCPIRTSADQFLFADPRSFSQLTTSFFAFESLGIPHTPFLTSIISLNQPHGLSESNVSRMLLRSSIGFSPNVLAYKLVLLCVIASALRQNKDPPLLLFTTLSSTCQ